MYTIIFGVFDIYFWDKYDYNDDFLPTNESDFDVEFYVHDAGKDTRVYNLLIEPKKWCIEKYMSEKS